MLKSRLCRTGRSRSKKKKQNKKKKKTKRETSNKTLLENLKTMEHEGDGDTNCNWCTRYSHQRNGGYGNKRTSGDHPNYSIFEIDQNTDKSPVNLRRLTVTQIPVRNHQLTQVSKTLKIVK